MKFHKTQNIQTKEQLNNLIDQYINFLSTGEGKPAPFLSEFRPLINSDLTPKKYTWIDESVEEIKATKLEEKAEIDLIIEYKANPEKWRNEVIKPWSMQKLYEWIDVTYQKPLEYDLSEGQKQERIDKRLELIVYHNQDIYTDNPIKPEPPSYI